MNSANSNTHIDPNAKDSFDSEGLMTEFCGTKAKDLLSNSIGLNDNTHPCYGLADAAWILSTEEYGVKAIEALEAEMLRIDPEYYAVYRAITILDSSDTWGEEE